MASAAVPRPHEFSRSANGNDLNETRVLSVREMAANGTVDILGISINLPAPLNNIIGVFLVNVLLWLGAAVLFYLVIDPVVRRFVRSTNTDVDERIVNVMRIPIFIFIIMYGILSSMYLLPVSPRLVTGALKIYYFLLIILAGYIAFRLFKEVVMYVARQAGKKADVKFAESIFVLVEKFGSIIIYTFTILYILNYLGIDITFLVAGLGIAGLVIAFAAQDTLSNLFAGIFLLMDRPFDIGDTIKLEDGTYCEVRNVGMRSTRIYDTFNHQTVIIPNNAIANQRIVNISRPDPRIKVSITVGVAYGTDIYMVKDVVMDEINKTEHVIFEEGKMPFVRFINFGDSSLDMYAKFWVDHFDNQWSVADDLRCRINARFQKENITIPFPQRTLWVGEQGSVPRVEVDLSDSPEGERKV